MNCEARILVDGPVWHQTSCVRLVASMEHSGCWLKEINDQGVWRLEIEGVPVDMVASR